MQQMLHCEMLQANTITPEPLLHMTNRVASVYVRRISSTGYLDAVPSSLRRGSMYFDVDGLHNDLIPGVCVLVDGLASGELVWRQINWDLANIAKSPAENWNPPPPATPIPIQLSHLLSSNPALQVPTRVTKVNIVKISGSRYSVEMEISGAYASLAAPSILSFKYSYRGKTAGVIQKDSTATHNRLNKAPYGPILQYVFTMDVQDAKPPSAGRSPSPPEFVNIMIHLPQTGEVLEFSITPPSEGAP